MTDEEIMQIRTDCAEIRRFFDCYLDSTFHLYKQFTNVKSIEISVTFKDKEGKVEYRLWDDIFVREGKND